MYVGLNKKIINKAQRSNRYKVISKPLTRYKTIQKLKIKPTSLPPKTSTRTRELRFHDNAPKKKQRNQASPSSRPQGFTSKTIP
jgi:hypothetical protein